jgi:hypothetical protein
MKRYTISRVKNGKEKKYDKPFPDMSGAKILMAKKEGIVKVNMPFLRTYFSFPFFCAAFQ